jgi:hypothetical protein
VAGVLGSAVAVVVAVAVILCEINGKGSWSGVGNC